MKQRKISIPALFLLCLFLSMTGVKSLHHHPAVAIEDIVCPLDGLHFSQHSTGHSIFQAQNEDDANHCLICSFSICKVLLNLSTIKFNNDYSQVEYITIFNENVTFQKQNIVSLRAPPAF